MDLLGGLAFVGNLLNNKDKNNQETDTSTNVKSKSPPYSNFDNIYTSQYSKRASRIAKDLASAKFKDSLNPEKTGVIPRFYNRRKQDTKIHVDPDYLGNSGSNDDFNSDSEFTESFGNNSCSSPTNSCESNTIKSKKIDYDDPLTFIKASDNITNNTAYETKFLKDQKSARNSFLTQFEDLTFDNPGAPVSSNSIATKSGVNGQTAKIELERKLALDGGYSQFKTEDDMTYNMVNKANFVHNNMKPFFSGRTYGQDPYHEGKLNDVKQRKLEFFTGSANNVEWRPRTERRPLFDPSIGQTNIYGTPVMTDYYESRYIPSLERKGELPFQPTRIGPGLNLGYNDIGLHGYTDTYRVLPKTVDELRVANNPKVSYKGMIVEGMKGQRGPLPSKLFKRHPLTYKENKDEDILPTLGYLRAPSIYGNVDPDNMATVNRGAKETPWYSAAKLFTDKSTPDGLIPKVRDAFKQPYKHAAPRNVQSLEAKAVKVHEGYVPRETQRVTANPYIGPAGIAQIEKIYAFDKINAIPDPNMRTVHDKTDRAGFIGQQTFDKTYAFDKINAIPDPNMRTVHDKTDRAGFVGNPTFDKTYAFDKINAIPDPNMRTIHDKTERAGFIGNPTFDKTYAFDKINAIPDPNMRTIHDKTERAGFIGNPTFDKTYVFDKINAIPDPNMRTIHDKTERAGFIGNPTFDKTYVFDKINAIPDPNMRTIHDKTERAGFIGNTTFDKTYAFDKINAIPDPNMRTVHDRTERAGFIGTGAFDKTYAFDKINAIPDPNMRTVHDKTERAGFIGTGAFDKTYAFDKINAIPDPNMRTVHDKTDRAGFMGNGELSKTYAFDKINAIPDPNMRTVHDKTDRAGFMGNGELSKTYAFDKINAIPDPNMRTVHDKTDRAGFMGNGELSKTYAFDSINAIPDATMRDIHNKNRPGIRGPTFDVEQPRGRGDANNTRVNTAKEVVARGRRPTTSNYDKGPTSEFTLFSFCEPIQINRELYPEPKHNTTDKLGSLSTRSAHPLPPQGWHFYSYVDENLKGNPYINNVVHQSPTY